MGLFDKKPKTTGIEKVDIFQAESEVQLALLIANPKKKFYCDSNYHRFYVDGKPKKTTNRHIYDLITTNIQNNKLPNFHQDISDIKHPVLWYDVEDKTSTSIVKTRFEEFGKFVGEPGDVDNISIYAKVMIENMLKNPNKLIEVPEHLGLIEKQKVWGIVVDTLFKSELYQTKMVSMDSGKFTIKLYKPEEKINLGLNFKLINEELNSEGIKFIGQNNSESLKQHLTSGKVRIVPTHVWIGNQVIKQMQNCENEWVEIPTVSIGGFVQTELMRKQIFDYVIENFVRKTTSGHFEYDNEKLLIKYVEDSFEHQFDCDKQIIEKIGKHIIDNKKDYIDLANFELPEMDKFRLKSLLKSFFNGHYPTLDFNYTEDCQIMCKGFKQTKCELLEKCKEEEKEEEKLMINPEQLTFLSKDNGPIVGERLKNQQHIGGLINGFIQNLYAHQNEFFVCNELNVVTAQEVYNAVCEKINILPDRDRFLFKPETFEIGYFKGDIILREGRNGHKTKLEKSDDVDNPCVFKRTNGNNNKASLDFFEEELIRQISNIIKNKNSYQKIDYVEIENQGRKLYDWLKLILIQFDAKFLFDDDNFKIQYVHIDYRFENILFETCIELISKLLSSPNEFIYADHKINNRSGLFAKMKFILLSYFNSKFIFNDFDYSIAYLDGTSNAEDVTELFYNFKKFINNEINQANKKPNKFRTVSYNNEKIDEHVFQLLRKEIEKQHKEYLYYFDLKKLRFKLVSMDAELIKQSQEFIEKCVKYPNNFYQCVEVKNECFTIKPEDLYKRICNIINDNFIIGIGIGQMNFLFKPETFEIGYFTEKQRDLNLTEIQIKIDDELEKQTHEFILKCWKYPNRFYQCTKFENEHFTIKPEDLYKRVCFIIENYRNCGISDENTKQEVFAKPKVSKESFLFKPEVLKIGYFTGKKPEIPNPDDVPLATRLKYNGKDKEKYIVDLNISNIFTKPNVFVGIHSPKFADVDKYYNLVKDKLENWFNQCEFEYQPNNYKIKFICDEQAELTPDELIKEAKLLDVEAGMFIEKCRKNPNKYHVCDAEVSKLQTSDIYRYLLEKIHIRHDMEKFHYKATDFKIGYFETIQDKAFADFIEENCDDEILEQKEGVDFEEIIDAFIHHAEENLDSCMCLTPEIVPDVDFMRKLLKEIHSKVRLKYDEGDFKLRLKNKKQFNLTIFKESKQVSTCTDFNEKEPETFEELFDQNPLNQIENKFKEFREFVDECEKSLSEMIEVISSKFEEVDSEFNTREFNKKIQNDLQELFKTELQTTNLSEAQIDTLNKLKTWVYPNKDNLNDLEKFAKENSTENSTGHQDHNLLPLCLFVIDNNNSELYDALSRWFPNVFEKETLDENFVKGLTEENTVKEKKSRVSKKKKSASEIKEEKSWKKDFVEVPKKKI